MAVNERPVSDQFVSNCALLAGERSEALGTCSGRLLFDGDMRCGSVLHSTYFRVFSEHLEETQKAAELRKFL